MIWLVTPSTDTPAMYNNTIALMLTKDEIMSA